ncbi:hypothetical protein BKI52_13185 [marine bacterium AO1-C]|nr:hypothetical protein BKI52_13185 [marine bacterium AO1-C]
MKYLSLLIIFFSYISCLAQTNTPKVNKLVSEIAGYGKYTSKFTGGYPVNTPQWARFEQLKQLATDQDLINFTDHPSPVVRCYAFQALSERKHSSTFAVLVKHLKDTITIHSIQGCLLKGQLVSQFFLKNTSYLSYTKDQYRLSKKEKNEIDSLLILDPQINPRLTKSMLGVISPKEQYYTNIKQLYLQDKSLRVLVALASYQKESDKALILEQLKTKGTFRDRWALLKVIKNYPAPEFFPYLRKLLPQSRKNKRLIPPLLFYTALVQYKTQESKELIQYVLKNSFKEDLEGHQGYIWLAITKYPHPIYKAIKKSIKLDKETKRDLLYEFEHTMYGIK